MGIGEFSPTAAFQLEKNLQHARYLVAAGMPLLLGLMPFYLQLHYYLFFRDISLNIR